MKDYNEEERDYTIRQAKKSALFTLGLAVLILTLYLANR